MKEIRIEAKVHNLEEVQQFVNEQLIEHGCPAKVRTQISIAVEEIFVNIASYAYDPGTGAVQIQTEIVFNPRKIEISFTDTGVPYNPLAKEDPDTTLSAERRQIGGLGIFMVKKSMDDMKYEYRDGKNILTIEKKF